MKIRQFKKEDAEVCSKIISECVSRGSNLTERARKKIISTSTPESLIKRMKKRYYYICESSGRIIGIGALDKNQVRTIYVHPKFQNKGAGSLILKRIEEKAKEKNIKKLLLYSHPEVSNFYLRNKFKVIKKYKDKGMKVVYMEKKL